MADDQGLGPTVADHEEVIAHQPTSMMTDEDPNNGGGVVRNAFRRNNGQSPKNP